MDPRELTEAINAYNAELEEAKQRRADKIRQAHKEGMTQKEIVAATGYTRETIRRILNPDAAEAVKEAAARRRRIEKEA